MPMQILALHTPEANCPDPTHRKVPYFEISFKSRVEHAVVADCSYILYGELPTSACVICVSGVLSSHVFCARALSKQCMYGWLQPDDQ